MNPPWLRIRSIRSFASARFTACSVLLLCATLVHTQPGGWTTPFPGHRVIANLYAVGTYDLGVFLITSDEGHILINTGLEDSTPLIQQNIESVGFRLEDISILLTMQAHWDHTAALAEIKEIAEGEMWATTDDARVLEDGGFSDPLFGGSELFKPVTVEKIISDGDVIDSGHRHRCHFHGDEFPIETQTVPAPGRQHGCLTHYSSIVGGRHRPSFPLELSSSRRRPSWT